MKKHKFDDKKIQLINTKEKLNFVIVMTVTFSFLTLLIFFFFLPFTFSFALSTHILLRSSFFLASFLSLLLTFFLLLPSSFFFLLGIVPLSPSPPHIFFFFFILSSFFSLLIAPWRNPPLLPSLWPPLPDLYATLSLPSICQNFWFVFFLLVCFFFFFIISFCWAVLATEFCKLLLLIKKIENIANLHSFFPRTKSTQWRSWGVLFCLIWGR